MRWQERRRPSWGISGRCPVICDRCQHVTAQRNSSHVPWTARRRLEFCGQPAHALRSLIVLGSAAARRHARRQGALARARCPRRPGWPPPGLLGAGAAPSGGTGVDGGRSRHPGAAGECRQHPVAAVPPPPCVPPAPLLPAPCWDCVAFLLAVPGLIAAASWSSPQGHHHHHHHKRRRAEPEEVTCQDVSDLDPHSDDRCAFVRTHCKSESLINYPRLYYCHVARHKWLTYAMLVRAGRQLSSGPLLGLHLGGSGAAGWRRVWRCCSCDGGPGNSCCCCCALWSLKQALATLPAAPLRPQLFCP